MGLVNYNAFYVPGFAALAAPLMEKLKVGKEIKKAGSKAPVE